MNHTIEYTLKENGIANSMAFIEDTLASYKVNQRDLMEALLLSEETLLMMEEAAPSDATIKITISRHLGIPRIRIIMPGTQLELDEHIGTITLDQLGSEAENKIRSVMLRSYAESLKYRYYRNTNSLTITTGIPERILSFYTIAAIILAVLSGVLLDAVLPETATLWVADNLLTPIENLFISALMCITAPAVFVSITCSMFKFEGFSDLGKSGKAIIASYLVTSVMATLVGAMSFQLLKPGQPGILESYAVSGTQEGFSLMAILTSLVPSNIIEPFISVNSLQLMFTALVIGTALTMSGKRVTQIKSLFEELDVLCGKVSSLTMQIVPFVVYCSITNVILSSQSHTFLSTAELLGTLLVAFVAVFVIYCIILVVGAGLNPITFIKKYAPTMKNTFLKGSGVAAVPMTMRFCRRKLGIPQNICSFSIPLGSTINMDGNCVCLTVISLFFCRVCETPIDVNGVIILFFLVVILSLGAPIAPGTLILCLVTVLSQLGISTSVISLVIGINFILEMLIGMLNTLGDVIVALVISKREGVLNQTVYNKN